MSVHARSDRAWALVILARVQSERVGGFVPNPAGKVQKPCRYAVQCALDALKLERFEDAMASPALASRINGLVERHA
jgi:hypothetical protein